MKIAIHVLRTYLEETVSQNVDIGLGFNLMALRRRDFPKVTIKSHKLPFSLL